VGDEQEKERKALQELSDEFWTKLNIEFHSDRVDAVWWSLEQ